MSTQLQTIELEQQALTWPEKARALQIIHQVGYIAAAEMLVGIKVLRKEIDETFDPAIQKAFQTHRAIIDSKHRVEAPLLEAEKVLKTGIATFETEQRRLQREAEERAQVEAHRLAEEERLRNAVAAEQMGAAPEVVEEILEQPVVVPGVAVQPTFQRAEGVSTRESYSASCVDLMALVRAVAEGNAHVSCLQPNMVTLNALARSQKRLFSIPGCKLIVSNVVISRAR